MSDSLDLARLINAVPTGDSVDTVKSACEVLTTRVHLKQAFDLAESAGARAIYLDSQNSDDGDIFLEMEMPDGTTFSELDVAEVDSSLFSVEDPGAFMSELQSDLSAWRCDQSGGEILLCALNEWWPVSDRVTLEQSACSPELATAFVMLKREQDLEKKPAAVVKSTPRSNRPRA